MESSINVSKTEWDLSPLFENDNDPKIIEQRKINEEKIKEFVKRWKEKEEYITDPKILKEALDKYEDLVRNYGNEEEYYFWLRTQQNQSDPGLKAKHNQAVELGKRMDNEIRFFTLKIAKIPEKEQNKFLQYPELKEYKHFLEKIFKESKHLLSEGEEKLVSLKSVSSHDNWVKMVSSFFSKEERKVINEKGKKETKNFSEILSLLSNADKKVRDSAAEAFNDMLKKNIDVAEQEINSIMFNKKIDDEIRKMPRPDYSRHLSDDIESEIVDDLVRAVSEKFDISRRYYKLKAKLLGLKKLKYHERNLNYGKIEKKYSYKESVSLVYNMLMNLDKDFGEIFKRFVENGQIDVYPKKGKKMGGFCSYRSRLPVYVCLNYDNRLEDVRVIAHELGHGINFELMKKQKSLNMKLSLATAEAASTFMEDFALKEILKDADDESKLALMMMKLNDNVSSIMRQVACYTFEQELHKSFREKGYLSKEEIGKIFQKHMEEYMGEAVEQSEGSQNWWAYWGQIRQFFYNYSYASGLLISKALQDSVKKQPEFMKKVKEFLSAGSSESPKNVFKKMGISLNKEFWDKGLNEVESLLNETEELAKKLGKM